MLKMKMKKYHWNEWDCFPIVARFIKKNGETFEDV